MATKESGDAKKRAAKPWFEAPSKRPSAKQSASEASQGDADLPRAQFVRQPSQSYWHRVLRPQRPARVVLSLVILAVVVLLARMSPPRPYQLENASPFAWQGLRYAWEPGPYLGFDHIQGDLLAITGVPGTGELWAGGTNGLMVHSADGGRTWTSQTMMLNDTAGNYPGLNDVIALHFLPDGKQGWAAGRWLTMQVTKDGGKNWIFNSRYASKTPRIMTSSLSFTGEPDLSKQRISQLNGESYRPYWSALIGVYFADYILSLQYLNDRNDLDSNSFNQKLSPEVISPNATPAIFASLDSRWFSSAHLCRNTSPSPAQFSCAQTPLPFQPAAIWFKDKSVGFLAGNQGAIAQTTNGGQSWHSQTSGVQQDLRGLYFEPDARHGWAVGSSGTIIHTNDSGVTWVRQTSDSPKSHAQLMWPPLLFWPGLILFGLVFLSGFRAKTDALPDYGPQTFNNDAPIDALTQDRLSFKPIVEGLSKFLINRNTEPPVAIAITANWGCGKSSLMSLLRHDLERKSYRPVWFNAWHHQKEESLLAFFLQKLREDIMPGWWTRDNVRVRVTLLCIRGARKLFPVLLLIPLVCVSLAYLISDPSGHIPKWNSVLAAISKIRGEENEREGGVSKEFSGKKQSETKTAKNETTETKIGETKPQQPRSDTKRDETGGMIASTSTLGTLLVAVVALYRGMRAFGVRPAQLLSKTAGVARLKDLEAQTSLRSRFAREFEDLTEALDPGRVIVFIDDLDRCSPEATLEMLESVNFLVSSGRCFVVMAMDRERVEACVAMKQKDIAESLNREPTQYARDYLDKLVQIEIPIPPMNGEEAQKIASQIRAASQQPEAGESWRSFRKLTPVSMGLLFTAVLAISVAGTMAMRYSVKSPSTENPATTVPFDLGVGANPAPPGIPIAKKPSDNQSAPAQLPIPYLTSVKPGLTKAVEPRMPWGLLGGILVLIAGGGIAVWWIFKTPEELKLTDSKTFVSAGELWAKHITKLQESPRTLKRFLNRVRYMAMYDSAVNGDAIPTPTLMALSAIAFASPEFAANPTPELAARLQGQLHDPAKADGITSGIRDYQQSTNFPWPPPGEVLSHFGHLSKGVRSAPERPRSSSYQWATD